MSQKDDHESTENECRRKPYAGPELHRVTLKPEESLVAGCKTISMSSPGSPPVGPCSGNSCMNDGS